MTSHQWLAELETAFRLHGKSFSEDKRQFLVSSLPEKRTEEQEEWLSEAMDAALVLFFKKAEQGKTYGDPNRIRSIFGVSLEENYGLTSGPFLDLARAYWTYKLELQDLARAEKNPAMTQVLASIESGLAGLFFPTPGPATVSDKVRRETQRQMLEQHAPQMDIERFFKENPYFRSSKGRGCLPILIALLFVPSVVVLCFLLFR
jgi:hypothetical protein